MYLLYIYTYIYIRYIPWKHSRLRLTRSISSAFKISSNSFNLKKEKKKQILQLKNFKLINSCYIITFFSKYSSWMMYGTCSTA